MGRELLFARSFCDSLLSLVYSSRSSYSAATSFLASLWSGFGLRRQLIFLGRDDRRPRGCPSGVAHVRAVVRENGHL